MIPPGNNHRVLIQSIRPLNPKRKMFRIHGTKDLKASLGILGLGHDVVIPIEDLLTRHEHDAFVSLHVFQKHLYVFDPVSSPGDIGVHCNTRDP